MYEIDPGRWTWMDFLIIHCNERIYRFWRHLAPLVNCDDAQFYFQTIRVGEAADSGSRGENSEDWRENEGKGLRGEEKEYGSTSRQLTIREFKRLWNSVLDKLLQLEFMNSPLSMAFSRFSFGMEKRLGGSLQKEGGKRNSGVGWVGNWRTNIKMMALNLPVWCDVSREKAKC